MSQRGRSEETPLWVTYELTYVPSTDESVKLLCMLRIIQTAEKSHDNIHHIIINLLHNVNRMWVLSDLTCRDT
jgi:hypothetical protein